MALQSNADLRLLSGLVPVSPVSDPRNQVLILHLLTPADRTVPLCFSFFWLSSYSASLRIIVMYLTYFTFTTHSTNTTNPFQPIYSDKRKCI